MWVPRRRQGISKAGQAWLNKAICRVTQGATCLVLLNRHADWCAPLTVEPIQTSRSSCTTAQHWMSYSCENS